MRYRVTVSVEELATEETATTIRAVSQEFEAERPSDTYRRAAQLAYSAMDRLAIQATKPTPVPSLAYTLRSETVATL